MPTPVCSPRLCTGVHPDDVPSCGVFQAKPVESRFQSRDICGTQAALQKAMQTQPETARGSVHNTANELSLDLFQVVETRETLNNAAVSLTPRRDGLFCCVTITTRQGCISFI